MAAPQDAYSSSPAATAPSHDTSSFVRTRASGATRAERRVEEYLRALGLTDHARLTALTSELVASALQELLPQEPLPQEQPDRAALELTGEDEERLARRAVALAQARHAAWLEAVFGADRGAVPEPLWLRTFSELHPEELLGDVEAARSAAAALGDPYRGTLPTPARFREPAPVGGVRASRAARAVILVLVSALAWLVVASALALGLGGMSGASRAALSGAWIGLGAFLLVLSATGALVASVGFFARKRRDRGDPAPSAAQSDARSHLRLVSGAVQADALPRTALVMPIYEEDPEQVFSALAAMREALGRHPQGGAFEIFVLSDTRRPERAAEEERALRRIVASGEDAVPIFYRRRVRNERQKAGNLAEFFERFGHAYTYAVVLDADSLMRAQTVVEMVRRMEAAPRVALLQAPLALHGAQTLFARAQQFSASAVGPLFTRGLSRLAGRHGNYYGHNAVLRVAPFLEHCALPELAGKPPLGGHIMSHDFVEAALLCRAGWEVRIADDLDGSWEELPQTLPDYIARDRRWCQGNMQHIRIACAPGFPLESRMHMGLGVLAYLAGPLWLLFVGLGIATSALHPSAALARPLALALAALTALLLLLPRALGVIEVLCDAPRRRAHGGALSVVVSVGVEALLAASLAPLLMLHHARCVLSIAIGHAVRWSAQSRRASSAFGRIVRSEAGATLFGALGALGLYLSAPSLLAWLAPVWAPLALAIPLAAIASSRRAGRWLGRIGLLRTPPESEPDELMTRMQDFRALTQSDSSARFRDLVLDPVLFAAHLARVAREQEEQAEQTEQGVAGPSPGMHDERRRARLVERALRVGPAALGAAERVQLTACAASMRELHVQAWQRWPVESWQMSRDRAQLPVAPSDLREGAQPSDLREDTQPEPAIASRHGAA